MGVARPADWGCTGLLPQPSLPLQLVQCKQLHSAGTFSSAAPLAEVCRLPVHPSHRFDAALEAAFHAAHRPPYHLALVFRAAAAIHLLSLRKVATVYRLVDCGALAIRYDVPEGELAVSYFCSEVRCSQLPSWVWRVGAGWLCTAHAFTQLHRTGLLVWGCRLPLLQLAAPHHLHCRCGMLSNPQL